ncbi:hypothetical protein DFH09DRAFT_1079671 [Mycena vulgaris]|nr:hypothetical protein DFH09DRAFT_1079671 [Mycena vulgaris]
MLGRTNICDRPEAHQAHQFFASAAEHRGLADHNQARLAVTRTVATLERPGEPLVTVIDYTCAGPTIFVRFLEGDQAEDAQIDVDRDEHIARAARSGGQIELQLVPVCDRSRTRRLMFPQRSDSPALHEGLIRPFNEVAPASEAREEMRELLETNGSLMEIH